MIYEVGSEMEYYECGNRGRVLVLACDRVTICGKQATRVRLRALEQLTGSSMVYPVEAGREWDAEQADDAGCYGAWYLYPVKEGGKG